MNRKIVGMANKRRPAETVLDMARKAGVLRARDLEPQGIPRVHLRVLCDRGVLRQIGRGLYMLPGSPVTEHHTLAEAARKVPSGAVCLLSALNFHRLTTQVPHEVWMAIPTKAWKPRTDYPPLRIVRFSGRAMAEGIEEHRIEEVPVRIFSPAKTVADCFKYRNKVGLDVALEALRDCWRQRRATMDDLWRMADVCRVKHVMQPYLESLI